MSANGTMIDSEGICFPASAATLSGFRDWVVSDEFPEKGRFSFINQDILIDMSPEESETHNKIKTVLTRVISGIVEDRNLGTFYSDGMLLTNEAAEVSTEPDAMFLSWKTSKTQTAKLVPRNKRPGQFKEIIGTPDWVLEVVSQSSVIKDTRRLRQAYHKAGIPEYWLIDALGKQINFQILQHRSSGYIAVPGRAGWHRSQVFGSEFRLTRRRNPLGLWKYTLAVREG